MRRSGAMLLGYCLSAVISLSGCTTIDLDRPTVNPTVSSPRRDPPTATRVPAKYSVIHQARHQEPAAAPAAGSDPILAEPSNATSTAAFDIDDFIREVVTRNPTLAQMTAAWQVASARPVQVASLDDPMFGTALGPGSFGSNEVDVGYRVDVSQKFPFPGKLELKGQAACAEASAAGNELEDARIRLIERARSAYYDYYLVERALSVNEESVRLLKEYRENAESRYRTGQVPVQDVLQAEVEMAKQQERDLNLKRMREVAIARINTLMHQPTTSPLPPAPQKLRQAEPVPDVQQLQTIAISRRPDLKALADRIAADQASLALAHKEYYPDFEAIAAYDAFWQERPLRPMIGMRVNVPLRQQRRHGAVAEAEAKIAQRQAELTRQTDQVNFEVQEASAQVRESERIVGLYEKTLLLAAQSNVKAAQSAYTTGKIPFLSLIEAQRGLIGLRDRYYESVADSFRRRAALERLVGGSIQ